MCCEPIKRNEITPKIWFPIWKNTFMSQIFDQVETKIKPTNPIANQMPIQFLEFRNTFASLEISKVST